VDRDYREWERLAHSLRYAHEKRLVDNQLIISDPDRFRSTVLEEIATILARRQLYLSGRSLDLAREEAIRSMHNDPIFHVTVHQLFVLVLEYVEAAKR